MELWLLKLIMAITLFATNFMVKKATSKYTAIVCTIAQSLTAGLFRGLVFLLLYPEVKLAKKELEPRTKDFCRLNKVTAIILVNSASKFSH